MPTHPLVTVLMPIHNVRAYVADAAQSVLAQTMEDLEFLVVDDGSTDGSADVVRDLGDARIRVITLDRNLGIAGALNVGLDAARGKYLARMDADDISEPTRLQLQVARMEGDAALIVLGTARHVMDEAGATVAIAQSPLDDVSIRWKALLGSPIAHPTVMLRREPLERHHLRYDASFVAEDYEFWTRLLMFGQAANLPDALLRYRLRYGYSQSRKAEQLASHDQIALLANQKFLPNFPLSPEEVRQLRGRFGGYSVRENDMHPLDPRWVGLLERMLIAFITQVGRAGSPSRPDQIALRQFEQSQRAFIATLRAPAA